MITGISYLICSSKFMGAKQDLQFPAWVIIFGGKREFEENDKGIDFIELPSAIKYLTKEHILNACKKSVTAQQLGRLSSTVWSVANKLFENQKTVDSHRMKK